MDFVQYMIDKFSNLSILGRLAEPLLFKTACNMGPKILMIEVFNYIAGPKNHKGVWNLPHKFHLYLITIKWLQYLLEYHMLVSIFDLNWRQQTSHDLNPDLRSQKGLRKLLSYTPLAYLQSLWSI